MLVSSQNDLTGIKSVDLKNSLQLLGVKGTFTQIKVSFSRGIDRFDQGAGSVGLYAQKDGMFFIQPGFIREH